MTLLPLVPETSASTNSATSASICRACDKYDINHYMTAFFFKNNRIDSSLNAGRLDAFSKTCQYGFNNEVIEHAKCGHNL